MEWRYYLVEEAEKVVGCCASDLIQFGALGQLKLHVLAEGVTATLCLDTRMDTRSTDLAMTPLPRFLPRFPVHRLPRFRRAI